MSRVYRGKKFYEKAIKYNSEHAIEGIVDHPVDSKEFAEEVSDFQKEHDDLKVDGMLGPNTAAKMRSEDINYAKAKRYNSRAEDLFSSVDEVVSFQKKHGLKVDGLAGPHTISVARQEIYDESDAQALDHSDYLRIASVVSRFEGSFWACNRNGEYRGLFDRGDKRHWASGRYLLGLSFGYIQFQQDAGSLGELLKKMYAKNASLFAKTFGPHHKKLLDVTNRKGGDRINGRSPRVQKVGGYDLWEDYWIDRFVKAGRIKEFQEVQMEYAIEEYMTPAIKTCEMNGLMCERALAIVFDRSVQMGPAGARRMIGGNEKCHLMLFKLMNEWSGRRWSHRVKKMFYNTSLKDTQCLFT